MQAPDLGRSFISMDLAHVSVQTQAALGSFTASSVSLRCFTSCVVARRSGGGVAVSCKLSPGYASRIHTEIYQSLRHLAAAHVVELPSL